MARRALAARKLADLRGRLLPREAEAAELGANGALAGTLHQERHVLERRFVAVQLLHLILGEVSDLHLARGVHGAIHRRQLGGEQAREGGLAVAVAAEQRDAVVGVEAQVEALEDRRVVVTDAGEVERDERRAQLVRRREIEAERGVVDELGDGLHLAQHLGAALRLLRGGSAGGVAGDVILQLLALGLLLGTRGGDLRLALGTLALERVVAAGIKRQLAALEVEDVVDDVVEEVALVADEQNGGGIGLQEVLQPQHRLQVEVVGGLVEQQQVGLREQQAGECHAHPPAAGEAVERTVLRFLVEAEAEQDLRRPAGGGVGVDGDQALIDVAEPVGILRGLAFDQQRGAFGVGGEHGLERGGEAGGRFLRDIAEPGTARHLDGSAVGFEQVGEDTDQRGLAGAVAADQPDAALGRQLGGGAVDDRAAAEAHGDAGDVEHGRPLAGAADTPKGGLSRAGRRSRGR